MVTLSNGTQIEEYRMPNDGTDAVVQPDGRAMTETEWEEYCAYVKGLSLEASRTRLHLRMVR
jgi:hypothetical protein